MILGYFIVIIIVIIISIMVQFMVQVSQNSLQMTSYN